MAGRSKEADKKRAQFWRHHIDVWFRSGLTQSAYCREKRFKTPSTDLLEK